MKHVMLVAALCLAMIATADSAAGMAADTEMVMPAVAARWTFDGSIHNNSLAISPDERTAVVSYSDRPDVIV